MTRGWDVRAACWRIIFALWWAAWQAALCAEAQPEPAARASLLEALVLGCASSLYVLLDAADAARSKSGDVPLRGRNGPRACLSEGAWTVAGDGPQGATSRPSPPQADTAPLASKLLVRQQV